MSDAVKGPYGKMIKRGTNYLRMVYIFLNEIKKNHLQGLLNGSLKGILKGCLKGDLKVLLKEK